MHVNVHTLDDMYMYTNAYVHISTNMHACICSLVTMHGYSYARDYTYVHAQIHIDKDTCTYSYV